MGTIDVSPALRERLGPEATVGLLDLLSETKKEWKTEVIEAAGDRFERRLVEETSKLRVEMTNGFAALRQEMATGFAMFRQEMADQRFELLKWTFIFWVGQVFALGSLLAILIRMLRPDL